MRQTGVVIAPEEERRRPRLRVDFGVDGTWEQAPSRSGAQRSVTSVDVRPTATPPDWPAVPARPGAGATATTRCPATAPTRAAGTAPIRPGASRTSPAPRTVPVTPSPRRTVTIRGRGAERDLAFPPPHATRRRAVPRHERSGFRPDRAAMWAVLLGLLLVVVAVTSAHGAVLARPVTAAHPPALRGAPTLAHRSGADEPGRPG